MHYTARENGRAFFEVYVKRLGRVCIVDVGSLDLNGSLRELCPPEAAYVGVDLSPGRGVDIVLDDPYTLPFPDASQDVVVSTSCFEHTEMFWLVFSEVLRILKPAGLFYLNAPSNGAVHRYPMDCWRFYPDSGRALVAWARRTGLTPALLESYTSRQKQGFFNDFVAVFLKDEACAAQHPGRIVLRITDFANGTVHGREDLLNPRMATEDQELRWKQPKPSLLDTLGAYASSLRKKCLPRPARSGPGSPPPEA